MLNPRGGLPSQELAHILQRCGEGSRINLQRKGCRLPERLTLRYFEIWEKMGRSNTKTPAASSFILSSMTVRRAVGFDKWSSRKHDLARNMWRIAHE